LDFQTLKFQLFGKSVVFAIVFYVVHLTLIALDQSFCFLDIGTVLADLSFEVVYLLGEFLDTTFSVLQSRLPGRSLPWEVHLSILRFHRSLNRSAGFRKGFSVFSATVFLLAHIRVLILSQLMEGCPEAPDFKGQCVYYR
jgi:hypothetical protein